MNTIYCTPKTLCTYFTALNPHIKFVAAYPATDPNLSTFMKYYDNCTFIYCLTVNTDDKQIIIYIGQSSNQYARTLSHRKKYDYDNIYLFSVPRNEKNEIEEEAIKHFKPLYNRQSNHTISEKITSVGVHHDEYKTKQQILNDIKRWKESYQIISKTFHLPAKYVAIIRYVARSKALDENDFIAQILDNMFPSEIFQKALDSEIIDTDENSNLVTTAEYGRINHKSVEQIKVFCRNGRIKNAKKIGRDWMIPVDSPYPEDRRNSKTVC